MKQFSSLLEGKWSSFKLTFLSPRCGFSLKYQVLFQLLLSRGMLNQKKKLILFFSPWEIPWKSNCHKFNNKFPWKHLKYLEPKIPMQSPFLWDIWRNQTVLRFKKKNWEKNLWNEGKNQLLKIQSIPKKECSAHHNFVSSSKLNNPEHAIFLERSSSLKFSPKKIFSKKTFPI